ncbi:APC4 [Auxenochlorella protothecoides x Auxenochlorella symbiontica]
MCSAFTPLLERQLPCAVRHAAWCTTMDLLALVLEDNRLLLHRLNWQRLWVTTQDPQISALAWSQDGRELLVGGEDGSVTLLAAEDGAVMQRARLLPAPHAVVAVQWVEAPLPDATPLFPDRVRRFFPPQKHSPALGLAGMGSRPAVGWPAEPASVSLLLALSAPGDLVISTSTLQPLIQLTQTSQPAGDAAITASLSPDLAHCAVMCRSGDGGVTMTIRGTACLSENLAMLHRFGTMSALSRQLLGACMTAAGTMHQEWQTQATEWKAFAAGLRQTLDKFGDSTSVVCTLERVLRDGTISDGLQQYLSVDFGETGLKKLSRAVDGAVLSTHALMLDDVAPTLEQLAFLMGELRGASQLPAWKAVLSLDTVAVTRLEEQVLLLCLHVDTERRRLLSRGETLRMFFAWLLTVMRRVHQTSPDAMAWFPESHLKAVTRFLMGKAFDQDPTADFLLPKEGAEASHMPNWADFVLEQARAWSARGQDVQACAASPPLQPWLIQLQGRLDRILEAPVRTLSQQVTLQGHHRASTPVDPGSASLCYLAATDRWAVALPSATPHVSTVMRGQGAGKAGPGKDASGQDMEPVRGCKPPTPDGPVLDCTFFGDSLLACISGGPAPALSLAPLFPDGPEAPQETRTRHLGCLPKRLAVSHSRKLACVLTSDQRALLFDLAADEEEGEEEREEEGDEAMELADD